MSSGVVDAAAPLPTFVCGVCGYGVARTTPPDQCPMCRQAEVWLESSWPLTRTPTQSSTSAGGGP